MSEISPEEKILFSRPSGLPGIEIMRVENSTRLWRVFHETYTVCTVLPCTGRSEWIYRNRIHSAGQRGVMLMEPGETHVNTKTEGYGKFFVMTIRPERIEKIARELGLRTSQPHFKANEIYDRDLYTSFASFHASLEKPSTTLERQSRYSTAMRRLLQGYAEDGDRAGGTRTGHRAVQRVREYIRQHFAGEITLQDLTNLVGVSAYHLVRMFTKEVGVAPHAYQIGVRLERARELLAKRVPPAQVAADLGFYDQSHFILKFKRSVGITPGRYLAQVGQPTHSAP
jgi:AraC-like DNA-binding protein